MLKLMFKSQPSSPKDQKQDAKIVQEFNVEEPVIAENSAEVSGKEISSPPRE